MDPHVTEITVFCNVLFFWHHMPIAQQIKSLFMHITFFENYIWNSNAEKIFGFTFAF